MGTKKCVEWGFGYGESEYEVSFGLAPRNGELSPSDPETQEPFNSSFRARNGVQIRFPRKIGFVKSKLRVPGHIYTEIKGRWLVFLTFEMAIFFD